ncbi:MlaD family protein [Myxococcota bacterium]|nr:MlaD family protein [Myxococcota bacterium]
MTTKKDLFFTPFKVGVLVVASAAAFLAFLQIVSTRNLARAGSYDVHAMFDDVLGLERKSPVQIAGIDVGRIKSIDLVGGRAKVTLEIDGPVELYEDAAIEKVSISLLGDYKLAIEPGSAKGRRLVDGDEIKNVKSMSSVDAIVGEVRVMTESMRRLVAGTPDQPAPLQQIVEDVRGSAAAARIVLEEVSKDIGNNTEKLDRILANIERFTGDMADISQGRDQELDQIIGDVKVIAQSIRRTSENIDRIVSGQDTEKDITESVKSLKQTLDTMNRTLDSMASITKKIDEGQGTVGKLINDPKVHDDLASAVEGAEGLVGGIARLQTWVNLRSELQFRTGATKNYVQFILQPKEDKAYIFEVVDDPRGVKRVVIEDVETTSPENGRAFQYRERRTTVTEGLNFSLMFQKRFYWLGLRFGIIEGTGGVGADLHFLEDRLELVFDVNRFGEEARRPRIKGLGLLEVVPHIYVHGGVDDPLNAATIDYFIGLGIRFNDEDLKTLITATGGLPGGT